MKKITEIVQRLFAVPWLIFGVQHFMYVDFVANIVPAYFPVRSFWVYLTGTAMIAAGVSFIVNRQSSLAAALLGVMLLMFVLLIHVPTLASDSSNGIHWTRAWQDLAIASSTFMLAGILSKRKTENNILVNVAWLSRYLFAILLIVFGVQQFFNLDFLTAKVPMYLPLRIFWVYLTGVVMIITGLSVLTNQKARSASIALGTFLLLLNLLFHVPLLVSDPHNAILLTGAMLDLAITCGVFILADTLPREEQSLNAHQVTDEFGEPSVQ